MDLLKGKEVIVVFPPTAIEISGSVVHIDIVVCTHRPVWWRSGRAGTNVTSPPGILSTLFPSRNIILVPR